VQQAAEELKEELASNKAMHTLKYIQMFQKQREFGSYLRHVFFQYKQIQLFVLKEGTLSL